MKKQTLNKDGTPRKTGSGRTKGAASTILVKLSDVNKICKKMRTFQLQQSGQEPTTLTKLK